MGMEIAAAAAVAGTGLSIFNMYQQGQSQKAQYEYASKQAQVNSQLSRQQAMDTYTRGEEEERNFREQIAQLRENQKLGFAASGFEVDSGTPLDVIAATARQGEYDALKIRSAAHDEARAYLIGAENYSSEMDMYKTASDQLSKTFALQAGSSLLNLGMQFYKPGKTTGRDLSQSGIETGAWGR